MKKFVILFIYFCFLQALFGQNYCDNNSNSTEAVITRVSFAQIDNYSPNQPFAVPGYENFTNLIGNLMIGDPFTIRVEGNTSGNYLYYFSVFIDWNGNGVLNDPGEFYNIGTMIGSSGNDAQFVSQSINIPPDAVLENTRMRIIMNWNDSHTNPCENYGYGQTEDYTIHVNEPNLPSYCEPNITNTIAPITHVNFSGIEQNSPATSAVGYETYFLSEGLIEKGTAKPIKVQGNTLGNHIDYVSAFVDWNGNGILDDESEIYELGTISNSNGEDGIELTSFINVPNNTSSGKKQLRIIKNRSEYALDPCADYSIGQVEDYYLRVVNNNICIAEILQEVSPITRFKLSEIDNVSPSNSVFPYEQFFELITELRHGDSHEIILEGNTMGNHTDFYTVFVDWNNNGVFGANEMFELGSITNSNGNDGQQLIGNLIIPHSAFLSEIQLRVIKNRGSSPTDACGVYQFGQIEDYKIKILEPIPAEGECQEGVNGTLETSMNVTNFMLANDFIVDPLTLFKLDRFIVNIEAAIAQSANFIIMEDDSNKPGAIIASFNDVLPQSQIPLEEGFEKNIFLLPEIVSLSGGISGKKYWIAMKVTPENSADISMMEMTSNITTSLVHYSLNNGATFSPWSGLDGVFTVKGVCEDDIVEYCDVEISNSVEAITLVQIGTIENETPTPSDDGFENFESIQTDVEQGDTYEILFEGNTNGNYTNYYTVFVDWNQNGYLNEAGEVFEIGTITNSTGTDDQQLIGNIQIPVNAQLGLTKMRVIKNRDNSPINPCGSYEFGQIEDYSFNVIMNSQLDCEIHFSEEVAPITYLNFAGINNTSSAEATASGHELFLDQEGIVIRGNAYGISLKGNTLGDNTAYFTAYFDWDNNGQLNDPGEVYWLGGITNSTGVDNQTLMGNITIPETATLGQIRFRIIKQEVNYIPNPCGTLGIGQAEDYLLTISDNINQDEYCSISITQDVQPITQVIFAGIDNTTEVGNSIPFHEYFLDQIAEIQLGNTYPIKIEAPEFGQLSVFMDWNQNGILDDQGEVYYLANGLGQNSFITVPPNALLGDTRMRIIKSGNSIPQNPCGQYAYGQAEDYTIRVFGADHCSINHPSNNLEDGLGIIIGDFKVANDFIIEPNTTFTITNFIPNIITEIEFGNISIHEDDNGKPGQLIAVFNDLIPNSKVFIGNNFDWNANFFTVDFELPTPVTLDGGSEGKKYWVALGGAALNWPNTTSMSWETTFNVYSDETYYSNDAGLTWHINDFGMDGVFKIIGNCEGENINCGESFLSNNYEQLLNTFNGSANDFDVEPNTTFELLKFTPTLESNVSQVHIQIFTNNETDGGPGNLVRSFNNISPSTSTLVHIDPVYGNNFYKMEFNLPPTYLPGGENGQKYWIAILPIDGNPIILWEISSIMSTSELSYNQGYNNISGEWFWNEIEDVYDGVFELEGNCIGETITDCSLICPEDISITIPHNQDSAIVNYELNFDCQGIGSLDGLSIVQESGLASGGSFPIGTTNVVHHLMLNGEIIDTCVFTVIVERELSTIDINKSQFTFYPNPVKDILNIQSETEMRNIEIHDLTGKKVFTQPMSSKVGKVNMSELTPGVYIIKVKTTETTQSFKIVKK